MRALLGKNGGNQYPGFSEDPSDGFRDLNYDLSHVCGDFLSGAGGHPRNTVEFYTQRPR
jgi:hypothetical protein